MNKILYISTPNFLDYDLSLLKELSKVAQVYYLLDISTYNQQANILNYKNIINKAGIFSFADHKNSFPTFFEKYINYEKSFFINRLSKKSYSWTNLFLQIRILKLIKKIKPEIIHYNNPFGLSHLIPLYFANGIKRILTIHDPIPHSGEMNKRTETFKRILMKFVDKIIFLNDETNEDFFNRYSIKKNKVINSSLAPYGIYTEFSKIPKIKKKNSILYFGRISPYKGIEYLIEAAEMVKKNFPDLIVTIAGSGKFYFDKSKIESDSTFNVINRFIENEELVALINSHSIIVCPYTDATQSGVLMTAFAFLKPIIATRVGNFDTFISDNITGFIVPPKDSKALAEKITNVFSDTFLLEIIRDNIIKDDEIGIDSWKKIAEDISVFYDKMLS